MVEWWIWDHCQHMCRTLYNTDLKQRTQMISPLEKELFSLMKKHCVGQYNEHHGIFELIDKNGERWVWEWAERRLVEITHIKTGNHDTWGNPHWVREYDKSWGTDIEQPVLRFFRIDGIDGYSRKGLFIYSSPSPNNIFADFVDELNFCEDFTTKPLRNMSWTFC